MPFSLTLAEINLALKLAISISMSQPSTAFKEKDVLSINICATSQVSNGIPIHSENHLATFIECS